MRFGYVENTERPDDPHMRTTSLSVFKTWKAEYESFCQRAWGQPAAPSQSTAGRTESWCKPSRQHTGL